MDWKDLRRKLPGTVEEDIVSKKNDKGEYIPYVNEATGNKVIVTKKSVDHFKSDHTSNIESTKDRQNTLHYEMIEAIPDIIRNGIWVESHVDSHGKAEQVMRVLAPVKLDQKIYAVKVTVKKVKNKYIVINGEYTQVTVYDIATEKEPVIDRTTSQKSASIETGYLGPKTSITGSTLSIRDFLQNVNDNLGKPYINPDGTPNYGIYFGNNKTGGVMYMTPKKDTYEQRAFHGSPYTFDTFDLGAIGKGEGNQAHGWGLYFAKDRNVSEYYKTALKYKGNSSDQLYEVEIPEDDVLLDEQKTIGEQPQKVQDAIMDMLFGKSVNYVLRKAEEKGGIEGKNAVEKALYLISEKEDILEARGISEEEVENAYNKALEYVDEEMLLKAQEEKLRHESFTLPTP